MNYKILDDQKDIRLPSVSPAKWRAFLILSISSLLRPLGDKPLFFNSTLSCRRFSCAGSMILFLDSNGVNFGRLKNLR